MLAINQPVLPAPHPDHRYCDQRYKILYSHGNHIFFVFAIQYPGSVHWSKLYQCMSCGEYFVSKSCADLHICPIPCILLHPDVPGRYEAHAFALQHLLRFIAIYNISFHSAQDNELWESYQELDPTFEIPKKTKLKELMISFANEIKTTQLRQLAHKSVSLMVDGCKRWGKNYLGVIIFTHSRLYLHSVLSPPNEQSITLAQQIAGVVNNLKINKIAVLSVNTDNAANNKNALNADDDSAQALSNSHFIRQPCAAHTLNLVIEDTFGNDNATYHYILLNIQLLLNHPPRGSCRDGYPHKLLTIRWISLYECVDFIYMHLNEYYRSEVKEVQSALKQVEDSVGWTCLHTVLLIFREFLSDIEQDLCSIAELIPPYIHAAQQLSVLIGELPQHAFYNLGNRFTSTCPLCLPWAAFFLTSKGLSFFRNAEINQDYLFQMSKFALEQYMKERDFPHFITERNLEAYEFYLLNFPLDFFNQAPSAFDIWGIPWNFLPRSFRILAQEVLQIPSTETACERLFSALSGTTEPRMSNILPETVEARLTVKFDSIFKRAGSVSIDDIGHDPRKALKLHKYPMFEL